MPIVYQVPDFKTAGQAVFDARYSIMLARPHPDRADELISNSSYVSHGYIRANGVLTNGPK